jgi:hypothetical protein
MPLYARDDSEPPAKKHLLIAHEMLGFLAS